jgi:hypothetical protein
MAAEDWVNEVDAPAAQAAPQETSWLGRVRQAISPFEVAKGIYNDPKGALQTTDDAVRAAANAMSFGMADRLAGYMGGEGTDAEVKKSEQARERSPVASTVGDVAGSAAIPGLGAESLAARWGGGALGRAGAYGVTGAATGAAQGAGNTYSGDTPDYVRNAMIGGALGGAFGGIGGAAFGGRPAVSAAATPTVPELQAFKTGAYNALNANPVRYDAMHLANRGDALEQRFATDPNARFFRRDNPGTFGALDEMRQPYAAAVRAGPAAVADLGTADIDFIRKGINRIPPSAERAPDRESGRLVKRALDDFIENPPPGAVMPGYAGAARQAAAQGQLARESNAAYKRAQLSETMRSNAENRAASNYSGLNLENELRKEYRTLLNTDKRTGVSGAQRAGYSPDEINRFQNFVSGTDTPGRNALRWAAKTAGGGSGLGALAAAGVGGGAYASYASDDPRWLGAIGLPLAGLGMRTAGNRIALRNANSIDQMVRQNSPLFTRRAAVAPMVPGPGSAPGAAKAARDAVALELMKQTSPGGRIYVGPNRDASDWE